MNQHGLNQPVVAEVVSDLFRSGLVRHTRIIKIIKSKTEKKKKTPTFLGDLFLTSWGIGHVHVVLPRLAHQAIRWMVFY